MLLILFNFMFEFFQIMPKFLKDYCNFNILSTSTAGFDPLCCRTHVGISASSSGDLIAATLTQVDKPNRGGAGWVGHF